MARTPVYWMRIPAIQSINWTGAKKNSTSIYWCCQLSRSVLEIDVEEKAAEEDVNKVNDHQVDRGFFAEPSPVEP